MDNDVSQDHIIVVGGKRYYVDPVVAREINLLRDENSSLSDGVDEAEARLQELEIKIAQLERDLESGGYEHDRGAD